MEHVNLSDPHLFEALSREEAKRVLAQARRRSFSRGEVVFHEGDPGDSLHIIEKGHFAVKVSTPYGDVATLAVLPPGEFFGEMALIGPASRTATVISMEQGETLSLRRNQFEELRSDYPEVTEVLLSILSYKVRRYTEQLLEALYVPAEVRVIRRLLEVADVYDRQGEEWVVPLSQEDLAGLAGTSRATVNHVLRKEERRGTVSLKRAQTTILDRGALERRAT
jgi:CRP/FNR family cyclic AMP-dependent transcriptional regulator